MRLPLKLTALVAALAVSFSPQAYAAEVVVPANRESAIGFIVGVTPDCHSVEKPKMKLVKAPAHGSIRFQWTKSKLQNISRNCNGRPAWGMAVFFKPAPGFRGEDSFTMGVSMLRYEGRSTTQYRRDKVNLNVK